MALAADPWKDPRPEGWAAGVGPVVPSSAAPQGATHPPQGVCHRPSGILSCPGQRLAC